MKNKIALKKICKITLLVIILSTTNSCKKEKLDEGLQPIKAMFENDGVWYVEKYEVDGVDSTTHAFPESNTNREIAKLIFKPKKAKDYPSPIVNGNNYEALFTYYNSNKTEGHLSFYNCMGSCDRVTDNSCAENVFNKWCSMSYWQIDVLTENKLVLSCAYDKSNSINSYLKKSYVLTLSK